MPITEALVVAGIVAAFFIFAAVLAWAEHQTRHLSWPSQEPDERVRATATFAKAA
jgi:hypothetical protein